MSKVKDMITLGQRWKYTSYNEWYYFEIVGVDRHCTAPKATARVYGASPYYATWPGREYELYLDTLDVEEGDAYELLHDLFGYKKNEDTPVLKPLTEHEKQLKFFFPELWKYRKPKKEIK